MRLSGQARIERSDSCVSAIILVGAEVCQFEAKGTRSLNVRDDSEHAFICGDTHKIVQKFASFKHDYSGYIGSGYISHRYVICNFVTVAMR